MLNYLIKKADLISFGFLPIALLAISTGCKSVPEYPSSTSEAASDASSINSVSGTNASGAGTEAYVPRGSRTPSLILREGDTIHAAFPGAPSLDFSQTIRRDGKITLTMLGEVRAAGLTPHELEQELLKDYDDQLTIKECTVTVQSSAFMIYVTGAVMRPGRLTSERVLTPLDALMEAGIDYTKANIRSIRIIRQDNKGQARRFKINVYNEFHGRRNIPFVLKPGDIMYVPERFSWY